MLTAAMTRPEVSRIGAAIEATPISRSSTASDQPRDPHLVQVCAQLGGVDDRARGQRVSGAAASTTVERLG